MSPDSEHTCAKSGRSNCVPCLKFEVDLWGAINRYAVAVGGDPSRHVHGNVPRMQAVADVGRIIDRVAARQQVDDIAVDALAAGHDAAAARACEMGPAYDVAKELARLWRDQRTAPFVLLDRLAACFDPGSFK